MRVLLTLAVLTLSNPSYAQSCWGNLTAEHSTFTLSQLPLPAEKFGSGQRLEAINDTFRRYEEPKPSGKILSQELPEDWNASITDNHGVKFKLRKRF